jgi:DNA-directed RNA polymerase I, II, and III subunit RPABC5
MIIPVRCMNCGKLLADKWNYYQQRLRELKGPGYSSEPTCFNGVNLPSMEGAAAANAENSQPIPVTVEGKVFDELMLTRYCCKKTLLTHVDLIEKI